MEEKKQSIAFAHYKGEELLGYRCDTFGTLRKDAAKLYTYSKEQVETVLENIAYTVGEKKPNLGDLLEKLGVVAVTTDGRDATSLIKESENKIYQDAQDAGAFEVRVVKAPEKIYEKSFNVKTAEWETDIWGQYPIEEMQQWLAHPEDHEVIETHYFSLVDQLKLN